MAGEERNLNNSVALVTGGGSGVGLKTAELLCAAGCKVMLLGSNADKLVKAVDKLPKDQATSYAGDVRNSNSAEAAIKEATEEFSRPVNILVNNAGTILRSNAADTSDDDWAYVMDVNVNGVIYCSRAFANQKKLNGGAIVNVSSTCGQVGAAGLAAYCTSKGAVDQLTKTMALELASEQITVNAVAPGAINSPMLYSKQAKGVNNQDVIDRNLESIPLGTIAEAEEVARAIVFLAKQQHITGTILSVDGGYTAC